MYVVNQRPEFMNDCLELSPTCDTDQMLSTTYITKYVSNCSINTCTQKFILVSVMKAFFGGFGKLGMAGSSKFSGPFGPLHDCMALD